MARSSGGSATRTVAVLAFPGVQALDVVGPLEVFGRTARWLRDERGWTAPAYQPVVVARRRGPLPSSSGCSLVADRPLSRLGGPIDTLLVAGGQGLAPLLDDLGLHAWLRAAQRRVRRLGSVCTGAMIVAAAGLLRGRAAVTHRSALAALAGMGAEVVAARVVDDGDLVTAGGVTSGLDLGLHLVERLAGPAAATAVASEMEITRAPVHRGPRAG
jgi:transcriptional regulator GlxA family with amidase domain